jgi:hypothetical protein
MPRSRETEAGPQTSTDAARSLCVAGCVPLSSLAGFEGGIQSMARTPAPPAILPSEPISCLRFYRTRACCSCMWKGVLRCEPMARSDMRHGLRGELYLLVLYSSRNTVPMEPVKFYRYTGGIMYR